MNQTRFITVSNMVCFTTDKNTSENYIYVKYTELYWRTNICTLCLNIHFVFILLSPVQPFIQTAMSGKPNALNIALICFSTSDGGLYYLPVDVNEEEEPHIYPLSSANCNSEGLSGCMNVDCTCDSSSNVVRTLPIHHYWSYKRTYLAGTVSARVDFTAF